MRSDMSKPVERVVSSRLTVFVKFGVPLIWIGVGIRMVVMFVQESSFNLSLVSVWTFGALFYYYLCGVLKYVAIRDDKLVVSNYFKSIEVSLSEIHDAWDSWLTKHCYIWLRMRRTA